MITLPITQMHLFISMLVTEIMVVSDPNYTVSIGDENYFSLAIAALIGIVFVFIFIALKFGSKIQFKKQVRYSKKINNHTLRKNTQLITVSVK
jgi:hypothetical protein